MWYESCARWYECTMIISLISTNLSFYLSNGLMLPASCWHGATIDPNKHNNLQCGFLIFIRHTVRLTLREKCPNTEFFLVRIQENTDQKNYIFAHFSRSVPEIFSLEHWCKITTFSDLSSFNKDLCKMWTLSPQDF